MMVEDLSASIGVMTNSQEGARENVPEGAGGGGDASESDSGVRVKLPDLRHWIGFGLFVAWVWLGLYEGYPCFRAGRIDPWAVATLMGAFAIVAAVLGLVGRSRPLFLGRRGIFLTGLVLTVASLSAIAIQTLVGPLFEIEIRWAMRILCAVMGAGSAVLLVGFGRLFSAMEPSRALIAFCASFAVTFFAFFAVHSLETPFSEILFSFYGLLAGFCLCEKSLTVAEADFGSRPSAIIPVPKFASGFVQMTVAFGVFSFAASLAQSFEPQKDFALGVEGGLVLFVLLLALVVFLLLGKKKPGTFKIIKVFYQCAIVMLVFKLVCQPLFPDDSAFASFNVLTVLVLFLVAWQLTAFVGSMGEIDPITAFALVFGLMALCMGIAWVFGSYLYAVFGRERALLSIAMGCVIAVFCTFGFSVRNFPYLTYSGKAHSKKAPAEGAWESDISPDATVDASGEPLIYTSEVSVPERPNAAALTDESVAALGEEYGLTPREREIFGLLAQGKTTDQIAESLVISYYTVRTRDIGKKVCPKLASQK